MFNFLKRFNALKKPAKNLSNQSFSDQELAQFAEVINTLCDSVEVNNLSLVSNAIESTSGHNNFKLVKAASYFVKECAWMFNNKYASDCLKGRTQQADYFNEFIIYVNEIRHEFEHNHYDPDGAGNGTITDILTQLKSQR
ncbi:hypothetical protein NBRC116592_03870 [Colwellia sp. KU-HH00111]|uniref:hypothetical protein n=1 Tax=Colwellia sp. KU-HH00111 TaxID=3127652 RepID=UPI00310534EF